MTHVRQVSSGDGNLIDVYYFCSAGCWTDSFDVLPESAEVERGGWSPCSESDSGQDVYCDTCGVLMHAEDGRATPVVVNLVVPTGYGRLGRAEGGITAEGTALGHRYVTGNVNCYCPQCSDEQGVCVLDCDYDLDK
jgi:hypothetical protein